MRSMNKYLVTVMMAFAVLSIVFLSACSASAPATTMVPTTRPNAPAMTKPAATYPASRPNPTYAAPTQPAANTSQPWYTQAPSTDAGNIGLSTGGAKDTLNFRENIRNGYLPLPTDITYEGLFYDYYFDTGAAEPTNKLFSPSYSSAVTRDPLSNQTEYYLSVGLNSGLKESDFQRKKLNLVIVLDNSGSMGESYHEYYYDNYGNQVGAYSEEGIYHQTKMQSANEAVNSILDQLNGDDRVAIVTFNSNAYLNKPMGWVDRTDMWDIKNHVLDIAAGGSTNLSAGIKMATQQFNNLYEMNSYEYENRMMVLTDAQPNTGEFSSADLMRMVENNAASRIYTTFIGIGVDFNSDLIEQITKTEGANYYTVNSPKQFRARVQDEFEYMVTPLVFNVNLNFDSRGWRIEKVFGSPEADAASGRLMHINTLFASKSDEAGQVKGGLVLLKLRKISADNEAIYLKTTYEDRNGRSDGDVQAINLETTQPEYFANSGIQKGVLLTRYAALLKNWTIDERNHISYSHPWEPCIGEDTGIVIPVDSNYSQWERTSTSLMVSGEYRQIIQDFSRYYAAEMNEIGDRDLSQEMEILNRLNYY